MQPASQAAIRLQARRFLSEIREDSLCDIFCEMGIAVQLTQRGGEDQTAKPFDQGAESRFRTIPFELRQQTLSIMTL